MHQHRLSRATKAPGDCFGPRDELTLDSVMPIDLDFDLLTVDGEGFHGSRLLGRPTILVLLRYLG